MYIYLFIYLFIYFNLAPTVFDDNSDSKAAKIAGIAVGTFAFVAIIIVAIVVWRRREKDDPIPQTTKAKKTTKTKKTTKASAADVVINYASQYRQHQHQHQQQHQQPKVESGVRNVMDRIGITAGTNGYAPQPSAPSSPVDAKRHRSVDVQVTVDHNNNNNSNNELEGEMEGVVNNYNNTRV